MTNTTTTKKELLALAGKLAGKYNKAMNKAELAAKAKDDQSEKKYLKLAEKISKELDAVIAETMEIDRQEFNAKVVY